MTSLELAGVVAMVSLGFVSLVGSVILVQTHRRAKVDRETLEATTALTAALGDEALFLSAILSAVETVIILYDRDLRVRFVNERFDEFFAMRGSSMVGRPLEALHQTVSSCFADVDHYLLTTGQKIEPSTSSTLATAEFVMERPERRVLRWSRHVMIQGGERIGMLSIFRDVTEQREAEEARQRLLVELETRATTDGLTGLANRRAGDEALSREIARARRHGHPLTVALFDIDHFKQVNDSFGHDVGDVVIKQFAQALGANTRVSDVAARWGGEEFVVILVECDLEGGRSFAERVRRSLSEAQPFAALKDRVVKASAGVTTLREGDDSAALVHRGDEALYEAKRQGRDRVIARG